MDIVSYHYQGKEKDILEHVNENLQDELIVQYLEHFRDLSKHGENAEIRECARLELEDYYSLLSSKGIN